MFKRDTKYFSQLLTNPYYTKDPKLFEIFQNCLPPREAYYFFHKNEDLITINYKKPENSSRKIFTNVPFTDFEKKWIKELNEIIDERNEILLPMGWTDGQTLGCIYTALGDIEFAYEILRDYIKWFEKTFPMNIVPKDKSWELLNNGFLYIYGRDHQFRPIMICQPYILQDKMEYFSNSDVVNVCLFVCQFAVNNLLIPGQVENWIMLFNLKGTSLLSLPEPIKRLVQELSDNFNFRLYKCYVLGMSFIMRILYKFVCTFIGQPDEDKIVILEGKKDKHLFDDFTPENLEQRFGGKAVNLEYGEDNLFPPRVPCKNVFFPWEDKNKILISEEEYIKRCNKGLIPYESISPYLIDKLIEEQDKQRKEINNINNKINNDNNTIIINNNLKEINEIIPENNNRKNISVYINKNYINKFNVSKIRNERAIETKNFLKLTDWNINDDEFTNFKIYKNIRPYNFINDVKSFIKKRERFKQGITKIVV